MENEKAIVTFEDDKGNKIVATFTDEGDGTKISFDFGDGGSESHSGMYAGLANMFFGQVCGLD